MMKFELLRLFENVCSARMKACWGPEFVEEINVIMAILSVPPPFGGPPRPYISGVHAPQDSYR